ncbi:MAG: hypothetical protein ACI9Z4_000491 [Polaribacter sp.]|jgi:hypothetical protein
MPKDINNIFANWYKFIITENGAGGNYLLGITSYLFSTIESYRK